MTPVFPSYPSVAVSVGSAPSRDSENRRFLMGFTHNGLLFVGVGGMFS